MIFIKSPELKRARNAVIAIAVLLSALAVFGAFLDLQHFLQAYLAGFLFLLLLSAGCGGVLMLNHVAGGTWGYLVRRILESGALMSFVLALLAVPLLVFMQELFAWTRPNAAVIVPLFEAKSWYLNVPFFIGRVLLCFAIFCLVPLLLARWSRQQDVEPTEARRYRMAALSAPGMILFVLAISLISIDFIMSLQPEWYSTMFGFQAATSCVLAAFAFSIVALVCLAPRLPQLSAVATPDRLHDLGNLLLALVLFWTYVSFSQFLIIYSGNLPEEVTFYLNRITRGWEYIGLALALFHFILPFAVLLSRSVKRRAKTLAAVAALLLLFRFVDLFWLVMPSFRPTLYVHWLDLIVPSALAFVWLGAFLWSYGSHAALARMLFPQRPAPEAEMGAAAGETA